MKSKSLLALMLTLMLSMSAAAETPQCPSLEKSLNTVNIFNKVFPQERVYLHFDNTGYFLGETIWFKAYLLRTDNDSLGSLSRVLYVELVDPSGNVAVTKKYKISNGVTHGDITLGNMPSSGFYEVRAYTRYMLNWGSDAVFSRVFPVFRSPEKTGAYSRKVMEERIGVDWLPSSAGSSLTVSSPQSKSSGNTPATVRFYPEGGSMVSGLRSRVAFEVTDGEGRPLDAGGWLEQDGKQTVRVKTLREGRGIFSVIPEKNSRLVLTFDGGKSKTYDILGAIPSGCVLSADAQAGDAISVTVSSSPSLSGRQLSVAYVHNGKLLRHDDFIAGSQPWRGSVSRSDMPGGVSQLVLMDESGAILADRMVFVYPRHTTGGISVTSSDTLSWPGKLMSLDVKAVPGASLSMSVCDASTQTGAYQHNAATWLLLGSDLRGYVNHPEYYLESDDASHRASADLLMMVQGWRRYDLETMDGKKTFVRKYPVEDRLYIDGRLKAYGRKNKVADVNLGVTLGNMYGDVLAGSAVTDSAGNYAFELPDCYRDWNMLMRTTKDDKAARYYVSINRHFSPAVTAASYGETHDDSPIVPALGYTLAPEYKDLVPMDVQDHWLRNVDIVGSRTWKSPREFWARESRGAKNAFVRYDCQKAADGIADLGQPVPSLVEWLLASDPDFKGDDNISGAFRHDNFRNNFHSDGLTYRGRPVIWIVDNHFICGTGMSGFVRTRDDQVSDIGALSTQFPVFLDDAKSVYVSAKADDWKRFLISPQMEGRHYVTVFVYTYNKPLDKKMKGLRVTHYTGYSVPEEYSQMMTLGSPSTVGSDYRRTLYWNPDVPTGVDGRASIMFKNNSTCRYVTVSAEGFTRDGRPLVTDR